MRRLSTATITKAKTSLQAIRDHLKHQGISIPTIDDCITIIEGLEPSSRVKSHEIPKGMSNTQGKR